MKIEASFRDQIIEINIDEKDTSIDFNCAYLIEISHNNGVLEPTGRAIDGYGNPLLFDVNEFKYTIKNA